MSLRFFILLNLVIHPIRKIHTPLFKDFQYTSGFLIKVTILNHLLDFLTCLTKYNSNSPFLYQILHCLVSISTQCSSRNRNHRPCIFNCLAKRNNYYTGRLRSKTYMFDRSTSSIISSKVIVLDASMAVFISFMYPLMVDTDLISELKGISLGICCRGC